MSAAPRPGGRGCPWLVVGQRDFRPAREQKSQHLLAPGARGPRKWRRIELPIAQVDVGAALQKPRRRLDGAFIRENVERRHAESVGIVRFHPGIDQPLSNLVTRLRITKRMHEGRVPARPAPRNRWVGAVIEQKTHDVRVAVMDGLVESRLRDTGMLANHLDCAGGVSIAAALEHLVLELTPRVGGSYVARWNCR